MPKQISYGECLAFKQEREALANNQFHAIQQMVGVKKWWCVVFKRHDEITTIVNVIHKAANSN